MTLYARTSRMTRHYRATRAAIDKMRALRQPRIKHADDVKRKYPMNRAANKLRFGTAARRDMHARDAALASIQKNAAYHTNRLELLCAIEWHVSRLVPDVTDFSANVLVAEAGGDRWWAGIAANAHELSLGRAKLLQFSVAGNHCTELLHGGTTVQRRLSIGGMRGYIEVPVRLLEHHTRRANARYVRQCYRAYGEFPKDIWRHIKMYAFQQ